MYSTPALSPQAVTATNNIPLVMIGLMLLLILFLLYFKLYIDNNINEGVTLDIQNTLRNIFRLSERSSSNLNKIDISPQLPKNPKCKPKPKPVIRRRPPRRNIKADEVFNIDNNNFTYDQAHLLCKSLDSKLATYDQLLKAHKKGANWCNYGWSANGLALYPIQNKFWNKLQKKPNDKDKCGKPGINGGFFPDKSLKFGVNCYGPKPQPDKTKITYGAEKKCNVDRELVDKYKNLIKKGLIELRPFNKKKWSKYSEKQSQYILTPKNA